MNPCSFGPYNSQVPAFQTWESRFSRCQSADKYTYDLPTDKVCKLWEVTPRQNFPRYSPSVTTHYAAPRYQSLYGHTSEDVITRPASSQSLISRQRDEEFSSSEKAFYPVVPYNTQMSRYLPVMGRFDITRLGQTKVLDFIHSSQHVNDQFGVVSLSNVISHLFNRMGTMENLQTGENIGTCTLIAENLIIVARHAVQGLHIQNIGVKFGYTELGASSYYADQTSLDCVIEEDIFCDYAIIKLKKPVGKRLGYVPLSTEDNTLSEPALLHYPLGKTLRVSVHTFIETQYQTNYLLAYHDSDYFSSGGGYFDPSGCLIAIHLGSKLEGDTMNVLRYARPLKAIVSHNPRSILQKFANGELFQAKSYTPNAYQIYLPSAPHNYLIDEEGRESEKILRRRLEKHLGSLDKDKDIIRNKNGTISFTPKTLGHIAKNYSDIYTSSINESLGKSGLHKLTRLYSFVDEVESDHTIPYAVWKSTKNLKMRAVVKGAGKRPGEGNMPAITIPYTIHQQQLRTTGGVKGWQDFHKTLTDLCDADQVDKALIMCYDEYQNKGITLKDYKEAIDSSLSHYVDLDLISKEQKQNIIKRFF